MKLKLRFLLIPLTIAILISGCTTAHMALPSDMPAGITQMTVEGRKAFSFDESFSFGPYAIQDVQRGWRVKTAWGFLGFNSSHAKQTYEFEMKTGKKTWTANCATGVRWKDMNFGNFMDTGGTLNWELKSDLVFACTFARKKSGKTWKLAMNQGTEHIVMDGVLTDDKSSILVEGTQKLEGSSFPLLDPTGYYFRKNGKIVGAVEVINNGAVWIDATQSKEVQSALACASAALMLYKDLKE